MAEVLLERALAPGARVEAEYRIRPSEPLLRPGTFDVTTFGSSAFSTEYGDDVAVRVSFTPG